MRTAPGIPKWDNSARDVSAQPSPQKLLSPWPIRELGRAGRGGGEGSERGGVRREARGLARGPLRRYRPPGARPARAAGAAGPVHVLGLAAAPRVDPGVPGLRSCGRQRRTGWARTRGAGLGGGENKEERPQAPRAEDGGAPVPSSVAGGWEPWMEQPLERVAPAHRPEELTLAAQGP